MKKAICCLIILTTCFCQYAAGQKKRPNRYFLFALEPNISLGNRAFNTKTPETYISNKNVLGIGLSIGYQLEWDHLYANARLGFTANRNAIALDFPASGFNDSSTVQYEKQNYSFEYATAMGLILNGGYKLNISDDNALYLGAGLNLFYTLKSPSGNSVEIYTGNGTGNNSRNVYYEQITNSPSLVAGANFSVTYGFRIGSASLFTGLNYYLIPGQQIKGEYIAFAGMPAESSGTMEIKRSYFCLSVGVISGRNSSGSRR